MKQKAKTLWCVNHDGTFLPKTLARTRSESKASYINAHGGMYCLFREEQYGKTWTVRKVTIQLAD